jgi:predicted phosphoadenosine phosphosulfate sulfurtransferase
VRCQLLQLFGLGCWGRKTTARSAAVPAREVIKDSSFPAHQGHLVVVDFKTTAAKWPAQICHSNLQTSAYLMGLRQSVSSQQSLFRYDVVTKTKEAEVTNCLTDRIKNSE